MIELKDVCKSYANGADALNGLSFKIDDGEFAFIVGQSGAGKSTLLKLLMREEVPNSGEVIVNGFNLNNITHKEIPYYRRTLGIIFQDYRLIPNMTAYDNVAFAMRVQGKSSRDIKQKVPVALEKVGLLEKSKCYPHQMSGGEQQRVGIARALVNNPSIIIADEPTGNVDPKASFGIMNMLNEINQTTGTTVLIVTHELALVRKFKKRIIHIQEGRIASDTKKGEEL